MTGLDLTSLKTFASCFFFLFFFPITTLIFGACVHLRGSVLSNDNNLSGLCEYSAGCRPYFCDKPTLAISILLLVRGLPIIKIAVSMFSLPHPDYWI